MKRHYYILREEDEDGKFLLIGCYRDPDHNDRWQLTIRLPRMPRFWFWRNDE